MHLSPLRHLGLKARRGRRGRFYSPLRCGGGATRRVAPAANDGRLRQQADDSVAGAALRPRCCPGRGRAVPSALSAPFGAPRRAEVMAGSGGSGCQPRGGRGRRAAALAPTDSWAPARRLRLPLVGLAAAAGAHTIREADQGAKGWCVGEVTVPLPWRFSPPGPPQGAGKHRAGGAAGWGGPHWSGRRASGRAPSLCGGALCLETAAAAVAAGNGG